MSHREGAVESDLEYSDLLVLLLGKVADRLLGGLGAASHENDYALGVLGPRVVEQPVGSPGQPGEAFHRLLDDLRAPQVVGIGRFPGLEEHIGILCRAAYDGAFRRKTASPVRGDLLGVDHLSDDLVVERGDLHHFVTGPETVEEVNERHTRLERGRRGYQGEVVDFLNAVGCQKAPPGAAGGHHIGVIPEYRKGLGGDRPGGYVEHCRCELAGDLEHVGDHQQEALGGRERGGQCATLQRSVNGSGCASLALQFRDKRNGTPDVRIPGGGPGITQFAHR